MKTKTHKEIIPIGGYIPDTPDIRQYSFGSVFGVGEVPRKFTRELPKTDIPFQDQIPSCVVCGFTFTNQEKSLQNDNNLLKLSWRLPFSKTGLFSTGRNVTDVAKYLQDIGQPQDKFCPNNTKLPETEFMNPIITIEGMLDAEKRRIGKYWWIRPDNLLELCAACIKDPVLITLGGISSDWTKPYDQIIKNTNGTDWYHLIVLWDYDLDAEYFRIINWWGDGIRKLSITYPLMSATSYLDLPDNETMLKTLKVSGKQDVWAITGNTRRRVPDYDSFLYYQGQLGILSSPTEVTQAELDAFIVGETLPSIKLMRAIEPIAKDIYQLE